MKEILLTSASMTPYTIKEKPEGDEYSDTAVLAILRKLKSDGVEMTDVFINLSLETGVKDYINNNILSRAIKTIYSNIKITFFPRIIDENKNEIGMDEAIARKIEINNLKGKEEKEILNYLKEGNELPQAIVAANKFGAFYPTYYEMFEKLEKMYPEPKEVFANLSGGTSAMQEDMTLISLTNNGCVPRLIQVSTPRGASNERNNYKEVKGTDEELKNLEKAENAYRERVKNGEIQDRVTEEKMNKTRKLMLLQSLEDSFAKHDFAGVYSAISSNADYIDNKEIMYFAKNLYYRYIGDDEKARGVETLSIEVTENQKEEQEEYQKFIEDNKSMLYPIFDDDDSLKDFLKMRMIVERMNIMAVKAKRNEINDWLLITQTVIESLYIKLIYYTCKNLDLDDVIINENDTKIKDYDKNIGKLSLEKFKELNQSKNNIYKCLLEVSSTDSNNKNGNSNGQTNNNANNKKAKSVIENSDLKFVNAYVCTDILYTWWKQDKTNSYLKLNVKILDKIRNFRNTAAHTDNFITKDTLDKGFRERINQENDYRKSNGYPLIAVKGEEQSNANNNAKNKREPIDADDAIGTTVAKAKEIVSRILIQNNWVPGRTKEESSKEKQALEQTLEKGLNVYETIQEEIMNLLKNEIQKQN